MPLGALNVTVIGGGSTYTPELIEGFIDATGALPIERVTLMDTDAERLEIVGRFAQRMVEAAGSDIAVVRTTDRTEALDGADIVLTQIRVGGMNARIRDERIPLRHDVIGQETTGPGGFAKALRTIPVMLGIAADMSLHAPNARLINFTNPSGLITEAVSTHADVETIGLCNSPRGALVSIAELLDVEPARIRLDYVGLNHLSWVRGVDLDGRDVMTDVIEQVIAADLMPRFAPEYLRALRMVPSYYLDYYVNTDRVLREQKAAGKTRGEVVLDLERELLAMYQDESLATKPERLEQRGGAHYASAAIALLRAMESDAGDVQIVNTANRGSIPDLPEDAVVEVPCTVDRSGAHPIAAAPLPPEIRGLVQAVKAYEQLTIRAAVEGDERLALLALSAHPLVPSFDVARKLWTDIRCENASWLPQFGGAG
jgi:6-phospho-beta-glucosidase